MKAIKMKNQILLNKINLIVTAMTVLMRGLIPVVYAHNQDWNDGFMGAGDDDDTCPNNGITILNVINSMTVMMLVSIPRV
jgi:hypothetical protein